MLLLTNILPITKDTKDLVVNLYSNEHISYANTTKFINEDQGLNILKTIDI